MIREIDAYELDCTVLHNGTPVVNESEGYEVQIDSNHIAFTCETLHDREKVDLFISKANKLSLGQFEKLMSQIE